MSKLIIKVRELLDTAHCPECDNAGVIRVFRPKERLVSREMAGDAGIPQLEGFAYAVEEVEEYHECKWCIDRNLVLQNLPYPNK